MLPPGACSWRRCRGGIAARARTVSKMIQWNGKGLMAMFTELTENREVYRNTPFEHVSTADPGQIFMTCSTPVHVEQGWTATAGILRVNPPLPQWLGVQGTPKLVPSVESIVEKLDWISNLLSQVQLEMLEDAADVEEARRALADPRNAVRISLDQIKKSLAL